MATRSDGLPPLRDRIARALRRRRPRHRSHSLQVEGLIALLERIPQGGSR